MSRRFTITQEISTSVDEHWRIFFDDEFERELYKFMRFPKYELVEHRDTEEKLYRKIKVTPHIEAPAAVVKVLGPSFGYVEDGSFDKKSKVWRSRVITNVLSDRMGTDFVVRTEPIGDGTRCRRTIDLNVEVRVFGIGGLIESVFEKSLRDGWRNSHVFLEQWAAKTRKAATQPAAT
jgi:hypothetical protein